MSGNTFILLVTAVLFLGQGIAGLTAPDKTLAFNRFLASKINREALLSFADGPAIRTVAIFSCCVGALMLAAVLITIVPE